MTSAGAQRHRGVAQAAARLAGMLVVGVGLLALALAPLTFAAEAGAYIHPEFFIPDLLLSLVYGPFGAHIARRSLHPAGWALTLVGLGFALSALGIQWTVLAGEHGVAGEALAASVAASAWVVGALTAILVLPWLIVAGRPPRFALRCGGAGVAVAVLGGAVKFLEQPHGAPSRLFVPAWLADAAGVADSWLGPVCLLLALPGVVHLVRRTAVAREAERRAMGWVFCSVAVLAVAYVFFEIGLARGGVSLAAAASLVFVAQVVLVTGVFALVVREESWAVDLAISRSIVAALLGGVVIALYIVLVWLGSRALPLADDALGLIAVAVVALGVSPLRSWLQRRVDDLVFGPGADVSRLLADLGRDLGAADSGKDLPTDLAEGLRSGLRLRRVEIRVAPGDQLIAEAGAPAPASLTLPLLSRGVEVGRLGLTAPVGRRLDPRTVRVVTQLSGLVAIAVELATVNHALDRTRRRLLEVRQEERRLIRRELHDGLGPSLSGIALALAAIANTSDLRDSDAQLLDRVCGELSRRADGVRQMARMLLPPSLELGRLQEALEDLAVRFTDDRFEVRIEARGADRLSERHRVAAYHIAAEGVRNAHRHADARGCVIRLEIGDHGEAVLEVADDGHGVDPGADPGVGLSSMRERAAELGGTFDLASGREGTRVRVVLP